MKILQIIPYFCFGGAETLCENLSYALRNQGHDVVVVSLYNEHTPIARRVEAAGIKIRYLNKKLGLDLSMVPKLRRIFREEKPDVVHTHLDVIKYATLAAKLAGVPKCVHTVHNLAEKEAEGRAQKIINSTYFRLGWSTPVALSPEVAQSIGDFYGRDEKTIPIIGNGIDLSGCQVKDDYSLGNTVNILHVGRFHPQKNHPGLLRSFRELLKTHENCILNLLGDGDTRKDMEALAQELGISEKVRFCGVQSNVYPYFHDADIFVLPSDYEGMPMTIIEAMATGLPIAATAVGGVPDMLTDGDSALLTACDEGAFTDAMARLIEDGALRERLGRQARADSVRFSAEEMARHYVEIYHNS
ncbi:MAG TPA: glycosyltransferase [Candidatus Faecousia faecipullorum]|nr:glycosyltransferase [Candidatus Faecousia faecipullorum]